MKRFIRTVHNRLLFGFLFGLSYIGETGRKFGKRLEEHKAEAEKVASNIRTRASRKVSQSTVNKPAITDHVVEKIMS